ncbi:hypothetical protein [Scytonema sp. PRP1]|uniref:hypothetical protein n=1 Tax=Scytonema sp. PRP1 TaxID=3120513 RepID=UPI002FD5BADA
MLNKEILVKIVEYFQKLVPNNIELFNVQFGDFIAIKELKVELGNTQQIYNAINFNIELISTQNESIATETPTQPINTKSIDKSLPENTPTINFQSIPFTTGFHLIINHRNWWHQEVGEDKSVLIRYVKLIPAYKTVWSYVRTIEKKNRFGFKIDKNGEVYVKIWADQINGVKTTELSPRFSQLFKFEEYSSGDIIQFENFPEIVISLDKSVVEKAVLVRYNPEHSQSEYFVFILVKD